MNQIFKAVLSMLLIFLGAAILSTIIVANNTAANAKKYHNDVVQEIESGNMSDTVINSCIADAKDKGYSLNIEKIKDIEGKTIICEVILKYNYSIPLLKVKTNHECRGFSR